jgi:hypothetical protein
VEILPCTHSLEEICEILEKHIPFDQRGLWSNNLRGYGSLCRRVFNPSVSNLNVHCSTEAYEEMKRDWPECEPIGKYDSSHSPVYVAMDDIKELTYQDKVELINRCDINQYWSAILCQVKGELKAYFCEIAGAQAMLTDDDSTGLYVSEKWWRLPITAFEEQIRSHCFKCGVPLKGKGDLAVNGTKEYVSQTYIGIAKLKKKDKEIILVEKLSDLGGHVGRSTDYIQNGLEPAKPVTGAWFPSY